MDRSKWEYKKLGELCDKGSSNIAQNKIEDITGKYPLYGASGYVKGIDFYHQEKPYIGIVKDGSGVGRTNLYPAKSSLLGTMQYIIPKDGCEIGFLLYVIKGLHLENYKTGAAIPHIYFKDYGKSIVPFPPLADQQRIVAELDCLNEMIALKQEQLNEFDKLAQSIFYDMFGDPVSNEKGWIEEIMGNVCSFSQGVQVDLEKQTLNPKDGFERFIRISDFTTTDCELRYVKDVDRKYHIDIDDIAIVRYGASAGFVCWGLKGILANNLFKLNHDKAILNTRFLVQQLSTNYYRSFIKAEAFGAAMPALSFKSLKHFKLILPPLALQQQFAEKIQAIEAQKELVKKSIAETQQLLDSRMDYYFD